VTAVLVRYRQGGAEHVLDVTTRPGATVAHLAAALAEASAVAPECAGGLVVDGRAVRAALADASAVAPECAGGLVVDGRAVRAALADASAVAPECAGGLVVDGRAVGPDVDLAAVPLFPGVDLASVGAHLLPDPPAQLPAPGPGGGGPLLPGPAAAQLRIVGGLAAGLRLPLPAGPSVVGRRAPAAVAVDAATVSAAHLVVTVAPDGSATVADAGSTNGTRVDGAWVLDSTALDGEAVVAAGTLRLAVVPAAGADPPPARLGPPGAGGRRPFHRPPRPAPRPAPDPVPVPGPPPAPLARTRLAVTALVAPLVVGLVAAVALGHPALALLALLGPVTVGGTWLEDRRRAGRDARRRRSTTAHAVEAAVEAVEWASAAEARRRRAELPDPAELAARCGAAGGRLWERRRPSPDLLVVSAGHADVPWDPPLAGGPPGPEVAAAVAGAAHLPDVPVPVDLATGVLGVCGPRPAALAVARSVVCQLAAMAGPADVRLAVVATPAAAPDWAWTAWLPHVGGPERAAVLVVDGEQAADDARPLLAAGTPAVVVAPTAGRLPSACTAVLTVAADGTARLAGADRAVDLVATGVPAAVARRLARDLARLADPEDGGDGALPAHVDLLDAVGLPDPTAEVVVARWRAARPGRLPAVVGTGSSGPFAVDLVTDGPHALVAGTTGAGKSELLRSLVAALAATVAPDDLNLVLLDYKGGSAFDRCADLPHVVGVVTDLDEHLGRRALVCLEAELRERERRLRDAGAADLAAFRSGEPADPMPRLVVVVDEFATMAAELPGFVDSLVGLAQRGRSLGIHLVLATQRPSGVVSESIRANTNLRIALRVQDRSESVDVVGSPEAAAIPRDRPGRAVARLGPGELVTFQAALATGPSAAGAQPVVAVRIEGPAPPPPPPSAGVGTTGLDRLVAAVAGAARLAGVREQRRPWPDPLPDRLGPADLPPGTVGLADEPERQRRVPYRWDPATGHLLVLGVPGSGVTTALAAAALALAGTTPPDRFHLAVVDCGSGALAPLAGLPHTGAVAGPADEERRERLLRLVRDEVDARRAAGAAAAGRPRVVLVIDGYGALRSACDGLAGLELLDGLTRVLADGPAVGVTALIGAESPSAVPSSVATLAPERLVLRQADPVAWAAAGVAPRSVPDLPPGRGIHLPTGQLVQVALPAGGDLAASVAVAAARWPEPPPARRAPRVGTLPDGVPVAALPAAEVGAGRWRLPVGIGDRRLTTAWLPVDDGDPVLVAGPPRSGRSTTLAALAHVAAEADIAVTAVAGRRSPLHSATASFVDGAERADAAADGLTRPRVVVVAGPGGLAGALDGLAAPHLVLVDDAEAVEDPGGRLAAIAAGEHPGVRLVVAARADAVRRSSGSWLAAFRRCRTGLALRPDVDADADLWAAPLPRRRRFRSVPGRGFLVADGAAELVQAARP
jgi:DNA segregation ATPase FtsK/SpoIIIE, S-DNA-T family